MPPSSTPLSSQYLSAYGFFRSITALVALYGVGMVVAGRSFALTIFDTLGFGPTVRGLDADGIQYSLFAFGVLGAVIVGWMTLMWFVVPLAAHPSDYAVRSAARQALIASAATWFIFDTGFSLVTSEYEHAAFNLPFIALIAGPLYVMATTDSTDKKAN